MPNHERLLGGLVSPGAERLYERIATSPRMRVGKGEGEVDPDAPAYQELRAAKISFEIHEERYIGIVSRVTALRLLLTIRADAAAASQSAILNGWTSLAALLKSKADQSLRENDSSGLVEYLTSTQKISALSAELYVSTHRELRSVVTGHFDIPVTEHQAIAPPEPTKNQGARFRTMYDDAFASCAAGAFVIQHSIEGGEEARIRAELPTKLIHVDDRIALVGLTETGVSGALLIRSPTLLALIREWFDATWDDPTTTRVGAANADELSPIQRQILQLLTAGRGDEAVAHKLGTSVRTVRRNVTAVMERLGVTSRFAAGAAAAKRGWI